MNSRKHSSSPPRIVLYSHDTLGFGHLRRNLLLAGALRNCNPVPQILMITGMREAGAFEFPKGVDSVTLPAYSKASSGVYEPRDLGGNLEALIELRAATIRAAVLTFDPHLMIVDNVPRGALGELDPLLNSLHQTRRTRLVLGLRDIIDRPEVVQKQWQEQHNFEAVQRYFDDVWVYGDPAFYDLLADCHLQHSLGGKGCHTGYLDQRMRLDSPLAERERRAVLGEDPRPYVVCAVGGGRDGVDLCHAFTGANMPAGHRGILITGSQMSEAQRNALRNRVAARDDMVMLDFVREPIGLMAGAARIVAMGGYNTICEILSLARPALVVPRVTPRAEQLLRAEKLTQHGLATMLHPGDLAPATLNAWLAATAPCPEPRQMVDMNGLDRVRSLALAMLARPDTRTTDSSYRAVS
ncbi:MAG: glycosyltransferase family protein [Marinobacter sp.]|uniref:glycosyltransferase family protein n=1 Tax=Marinobacter sp. TaxID=50741 RepID=UPI003F958D13